MATKYIFNSTSTLSGSHAAIDSNRNYFLLLIIQLQSIVLVNTTYGWLDISRGILLCVEQTIHLNLGQLASTISCLPSNIEGFTSVYYNSNQIHNFLLSFIYLNQNIMH